jgi:hypothetical protein
VLEATGVLLQLTIGSIEQLGGARFKHGRASRGLTDCDSLGRKCLNFPHRSSHFDVRRPRRERSLNVLLDRALA